jgi:hypothetical protein
MNVFSIVLVLSCAKNPETRAVPDRPGQCLDGTWWDLENLTDRDGFSKPGTACEGSFYTHTEALALCEARGEGWALPSTAQAEAFLESISPSEQRGLFPLSGNGGGNGDTMCVLQQVEKNGLWWLSDHNGRSGGAALFCKSGGCFVTGTTMGDSYQYMVRCVRDRCP